MSNKTFATRDLYGTYVYGICQHRPDCFSVTCLGYAPNVPLTPEEQAEAEAEAAMYRQYEVECGVEPMPVDYYTTAEAAQRATELHDAMNCASQDIDAFGAPSECLSLACKPLMRELEALEEKYGTRLNPPTLGEQYAERGLPDPTRPMRESLPAGMHDDLDVIIALGERPAL